MLWLICLSCIVHDDWQSKCLVYKMFVLPTSSLVMDMNLSKHCWIHSIESLSWHHIGNPHRTLGTTNIHDWSICSSSSSLSPDNDVNAFTLCITTIFPFQNHHISRIYSIFFLFTNFIIWIFFNSWSYETYKFCVNEFCDHVDMHMFVFTHLKNTSIAT